MHFTTSHLHLSGNVFLSPWAASKFLYHLYHLTQASLKVYPECVYKFGHDLIQHIDFR